MVESIHGGNTSPETGLLNFDGNEGAITPVGSYPDGASPYGALDMAGNVWEWVADWYDPAYYETMDVWKNPTGPIDGNHHVARGGCWAQAAGRARTFFRVRDEPTESNQVLGFRCGMSSTR